jgi:hypothetical protein
MYATGLSTTAASRERTTRNPAGQEDRIVKGSRLFAIPVIAMVVAYGWSFLASEPARTLTAYPLPAQEVASAWQQDAGEALGLRPALVERAMTEQEWETLRAKLNGMRPDERERYQQAVRSRILRQAQG